MARTPLRTLRVADDEWQRWVKAAKKEGVAVSELIRRSVTSDLNRRAEVKRIADLAPAPKRKAKPTPSASVSCPHPSGAKTLLNGGLVRCGACGDLVK